jgi:hypothetical protein
MRAQTLRISDTLELPLDFVTHRNAILAVSGAGKSNLAVAIAEEIHRHRVPWIAIDPKGDWWGIRASRDGKGPGLDVPVLGGEHGDLPLTPKSGARMAELVAAGRLVGVLDVSDFDTKGELSGFLTDFATTLLRRLRTPLHVFCEECDEYLPQGGKKGSVDPRAAICIGAWTKLAKRGRFRGLGYTLISQRSAEVSKSALSQCETLFAMRVGGKRDRDAIGDWLDRHEGTEEVVRSLASLADGEAWVWSPAKLKLRQRFQARRRETFDSGRTPEIGEALFVPKLAPVDIAALREELGKAAESDDPAALKARIAELESKPEAKQVREVLVDVPFIPAGLLDALKIVRSLHADLGSSLQRLAELSNDADGPAKAARARRDVTAVIPAPLPPAGQPRPAETPREKVARIGHRDLKPTKPTPARAGTPPEGWTMEEEALYQKIKARLIEEAPSIVKVFAERPELTVTIDRKAVQLDGSTLKGRIARLIAEGFFAQARTASPVRKELARTGPDANTANIGRALDEFTAMGILTCESDGYRIAPAAKVTTTAVASG